MQRRREGGASAHRFPWRAFWANIGCMATTAINTLRYARRLKDAGVPADQAEAMADAIGSELVDHLATKADLDAATAMSKADLNAAVSRLEGSLRLLQWMLGFTLAFVVAIAWRVFG